MIIRNRRMLRDAAKIGRVYALLGVAKGPLSALQIQGATGLSAADLHVALVMMEQHDPSVWKDTSGNVWRWQLR